MRPNFLLLAAVIGGVTASVSATAFEQPPSSADNEPKETISISCGAIWKPPPFSGRLLTTTGSGEPTPIVDAEFWRGIGEDSIHDGNLHRVKAVVTPEGRFSIPTSIAVSTTTYSDGSSAGWVEDVVFVIRRRGCKDHVVHFTVQWKEQDLLLECGEASE